MNKGNETQRDGVFGGGGRAIRLLMSFALATGVGVASCAWGYAGKPTEKSAETKEKDDPNVVEVDEQEGSSADEQTSEKADQKDGRNSDAGEESPCGVEDFEVHYFDASTRVTKKIDCVEREVLSVNRSPISRKQLRTAKDAGLPEDTWYLLVDPKGLRAKFLTNDQLIKISREFDIQFLGRDEQRNLLIYEYRGNL